MKLNSPAFTDGQIIPSKYTCDRNNINPELNIHETPLNTVSFVLIMDDPDAPIGTFLHWFCYNIDPKTKTIKEKSVPGIESMNDAHKMGYIGPCPPSGIHRYNFTIYAMNTVFQGPPANNRKDFETKHSKAIITKATLMGRYSRK